MTITVTQLNNYIHGVFDIDALLNDLTVCGEITNVKRARDGWYFSLKDDYAAVNCFCYASAGEPVAGSVAVVEGQLNYFVKSGSVSLYTRRLTATTDSGVAYLRFVELKEKLEKEGLFDEERKKPVPRSAKRIGVVTSETGAVIHDITNVVLRRQPFSDLILYPVKVQGAGAEDEIASGIEYFNGSDVDVVIVGRGGGSNEDLSVFNSETVVRAIAKCSKPIVSAVGHGIDFTLSDFAADKRAVTPSEAAEFVTLDVTREKFRVTAAIEKINSVVSSRLQQLKEQVCYDVRILNSDIGHKIAYQQNKVKYCLKNIESACKMKADRNAMLLDKSVGRLATLNPTNVLKRGYGYVSNADGVIRSVEQLQLGEEFKLSLQDGNVSAKVVKKEIKR